MIQFGREICNDPDLASSREWLITNGIGGFSSGTISGALTRRYHGLLFAALKPPLERNLIIPKVEEVVRYQEKAYLLTTNYWNIDSIYPRGYQHLEQFYLDGKMPVWVYDLDGIKLKKTVWMLPGKNVTCVEYRLEQPSKISLAIDILLNVRDYHGATCSNSLMILDFFLKANHFSVEIANPPLVVYIQSNQGNYELVNQWKYDYFLALEHQRGESAREDHLLAARLSLDLDDSKPLQIAFATEPLVGFEFESSYQAFKNHESRVLSTAQKTLGKEAISKQQIQQLVLSADQFIVDRPTPEDPNGKTIIAGYHWFGDWGRDTMISLPGLTLATNRPQIAKIILHTFARYLDRGLLPNRFPDVGEDPEYNTADATLWFFEAIRSYFDFTWDIDFLRAMYPRLEQIIDFHIRGTRYNIQMDPTDNLLYAGEIGYQLTWMDVKIDDWVVTPRIGKPVEINALWYNALCCMAEFSRLIGPNDSFYNQAAKLCKSNFTKFWNPAKNCLFDIIDGPNGNDPTIRPNQIIAASIHHSPLSDLQARYVLDCCTNELLTPYGLRSLAPGEIDYCGFYHGDRRQRDAVYHQGTVWCWLIGPYLSAHLRIYQDTSIILDFLQPLFNHLTEYGLGTICEVTDGDFPYLPNGCISQAWSVAEVLRVIYENLKDCFELK